MLACGSLFVGGNGCEWVSVCVLSVQYIYQYAKQGALNGFQLELKYSLSHNKRNSRLSHIARVLNVCAYILLRVCDILYVLSVCYVVSNCLCLAIHHRAVFLTLSLLSSVTNLFSVLQRGKSKKLFKNHSDKCFFFSFSSLSN